MENIDGEIWKEIEGYNGNYFVSNLGRVKSFKKWPDVRILKNVDDGDGYFVVCLYKNGEQKTKQIHILMYESFIGKILKGYIVHHIDFTKNNILENFQLMTISEHNILHHTGLKRSEETKELMIENHVGTLGLNHSEETKELLREINKGENNPNVKLTEQKVILILIDLDEGILNQKEIGEKFGVKQSAISDIKTRRRWKHLL